MKDCRGDRGTEDEEMFARPKAHIGRELSRQ